MIGKDSESNVDIGVGVVVDVEDDVDCALEGPKGPEGVVLAAVVGPTAGEVEGRPPAPRPLMGVPHGA